MSHTTLVLYCLIIKTCLFVDYEVFEVSSDDDAAVDEGEDEVLPTGAVRRRKNIANKEYVPPTPVHVPGGWWPL